MNTTPKTILSKEAILSAVDSSIQEIEVPEWNGSVCIRIINGFEREKLETLMARFEKDKNKNEYYGGYLLSLCICDKDGNRLFSEKDVDLLAKKSGVALSRLIREALVINNLVPVVDKKTREESIKN